MVDVQITRQFALLDEEVGVPRPAAMPLQERAEPVVLLALRGLRSRELQLTILEFAGLW